MSFLDFLGSSPIAQTLSKRFALSDSLKERSARKSAFACIRKMCKLQSLDVSNVPCRVISALVLCGLCGDVMDPFHNTPIAPPDNKAHICFLLYCDFHLGAIITIKLDRKSSQIGRLHTNE